MNIFRQGNFLELWKRDTKLYETMKETLNRINRKYGKDFKVDKTKYFRFLPENERESLYKHL